MKRFKHEISLGSIDTILRKTNIERISVSAKIEAVKAAEEYVLKLGKKASKFAKHAGRKTLRSDDIILALKE